MAKPMRLERWGAALLQARQSQPFADALDGARARRIRRERCTNLVRTQRRAAPGGCFNSPLLLLGQSAKRVARPATPVFHSLLHSGERAPPEFIKVAAADVILPADLSRRLAPEQSQDGEKSPLLLTCLHHINPGKTNFA